MLLALEQPYHDEFVHDVLVHACMHEMRTFQKPCCPRGHRRRSSASDFDRAFLFVQGMVVVHFSRGSTGSAKLCYITSSFTVLQWCFSQNDGTETGTASHVG